MAKRVYFIPRKDTKFFSFQKQLVDKIVANKVAWGIPNAAVNPLIARRSEYEPRYMKAQNKNSRTIIDVQAHREARKIYEKEIRVFVKAYLMFNPLITDDKRVAMGLTVRDTEPSPRPRIDTIPMVYLKPLGGGAIKVTCKLETDQNRPSMLPAADAVECRYILVPKGEMPPKGHQDCKETQVSKKAHFIISLGDENAGYSFWGFFRWVNLTNPANSGPWTKSIKVVIA